MEALGAFSHDVRTPITSARMVVEVARRLSNGEDLRLDNELARMLLDSLGDLQDLVDGLQEMARLGRGRLALAPTPCDVSAIVAAAAAIASPTTLTGTVPAGIEANWDAVRLAPALAAFIATADRLGDASRAVSLGFREASGRVFLTFSSGVPTGPEVPIGADAGFAFFRARQLVVAAGGSVDCGRASQYAELRVELPRGGTWGGGIGRDA